MKTLLKLTLVVAVALSLVAASSNTQEEKYRIGVILPLTGPSASLGEYLKKGLELAYSRLPAAKQAKLELIFEDDQLKSAQSVSAFKKLTSIDGIDAVFVLGSGVGNAVGPLAERQKKLMVSIGASDKTFAAGTDYVFIHWVSPEAETEVMVEEVKKRGYKRLALISHEQDGAIALEQAVVQSLKANGIEESLVYQDRVLLDVRDFRTIIAKIRAKNVDGVCVALLPGGLATFAKQVRDSGLSADLFGFELFEDENEVKASDNALVGKWYVNADEGNRDFEMAYKDAYGEHPGWAAANAFDTLNLIADAIDKVGSDNAKIARYLKNVKGYKGAAGVYSSSGDNRFTLPATVKIVTRDGFEKLY